MAREYQKTQKTHLCSCSILPLCTPESRDRIIKGSHFAAPLLLLISMSITCQDRLWTGCFTVELEQNSGYPNQSFSIKHNPNTLSGMPFVTADTNGYAGSASPPDTTRHLSFIYKLKRSIIEPIVMMLHSGNNPPDYQPSPSSSHQSSKANSQSVSYFTNTLHSNSGKGNGDPQQQQHTLGLNCFVDPCHGVCQFRPLSDNRGFDECLQNFLEIAQAGASSVHNSCPDLTNEPCFGFTHYLEPVNDRDSQENSTLETFCDLFDIEHPYDSGSMFDIKAYDIDNDPANSFNFLDSVSAETGFTDDAAGTPNEDVSRLRNDYVPQEVTSRCQTALSDQKIKKDHSRQKICDFTVIREDGQKEPCGRVYNNSKALREHKKRHRKRKPDNVRQVDNFSL